MSDHLSREQMRRHHDRELSPPTLIEVTQHLDSCPWCHKQYSELYRLPDKLTPIKIDLLSVQDDETFHLLFEEEIVPYVEHRVDETGREIVQSHLEVCPQCAREVNELLQFRDELEAQPETKQFTVLSPPRPKSRGYDRSVVRNLALAGGVAATIAVLILASSIFLRNRGKNQQGGPVETDLKVANQNANTAIGETDGGHDRDSQTSLAKVIALTDGRRRVTLNEKGKLEGFEALPPELQNSIESALTLGRVRRPQILAELSGTPSVLLGSPANGLPFPLLSPAGVVVLDDRPTFRWKASDHATGYRVLVVDSNFGPVAKSELVERPEWTIAHSLRRGEVYSWQVTAIVDGREITSPVKPAPLVQFKILESSKVREIETIRKEYPDSHLALGVLYANAGLKAEAEREFRAIMESNPRSTTATTLLRSIRAWNAP